VKVRLTDSAINDLRELHVYYEEQAVPHVGQRFVTEILDRIETLADNPDIGRVVPEFSTDDIRELIHKPFRVVYLRESSTISVIRVWRSERILELPEPA
jgi:toxin ParE1/3/4